MRPDVGLASHSVVFGLFSIFHGTNALVLSARAHEMRAAGRQLVDAAA